MQGSSLEIGAIEAVQTYLSSSFAISQGWYRIQKPLKPGSMKKYEKNPHPGLGPQNIIEIYANRQTITFKCSQFFSKPGMGDFVMFSYFQA